MIITLGVIIGRAGDEGETLTFDPLPVTTSTAATGSTSATIPSPAFSTGPPEPLAPTMATPVGGAWVDVTSNLLGLPTACGVVSAVAAHPQRPTVIASVSLEGLWANEVLAGEWSRLGSDGGSDPVDNRANSIIFDPVSADTYWESGSYGSGGVFKTLDGGRTFERLGDVTHLDALSVDFSDLERRTMLAGAHERSALYRSGDGGDTWTDVSPGLPADVGYTSQPLVIDSQVHLVGTNAGARSGIYRTTDGGETWQQVSETAVYGLPVVASSDGAIYWMQPLGDGLVRSTDGGATWTQVLGPGILTGSWTLVELPDGRLATIGANTVITSADHGERWLPLGPNFPTFDPYGMTYSAARDEIFIWPIGCEQTVPAGAIYGLDLSP